MDERVFVGGKAYTSSFTLAFRIAERVEGQTASSALARLPVDTCWEALGSMVSAGKPSQWANLNHLRSQVAHYPVQPAMTEAMLTKLSSPEKSFFPISSPSFFLAFIF